MKKLTTILLLAFLSILSHAQDLPKYELYSTQNLWNFLELDTTTGQVWQVQYYINNDNHRYKVVLNDQNLVPAGEETFPGRFRLKATNNLYNFLLLDTFSGRIWQIQWSTKAELRGIVDEIELTDLPVSSSKSSDCDCFTVEGPYNVDKVENPSTRYNYWLVTIISPEETLSRKSVKLEKDGKYYKCVSALSGNKYAFRNCLIPPFSILISGREEGVIEVR